MRVVKSVVFPAIAVVAAAILASCSVKKNTAASRQWQAFTTRYNTYFNGSEHYKEQLKRMEESYADDYTQLLLPHPAEARSADNLPKPQGDFTRTIEKMQKAIQLHSIKRRPQRRSRSAEDREFRKREEFNPFIHNAWLLMGRSQYMNGDFGGAATTFGYIAKHFPWLPEVVTEAKIWQARSHAAQGWLYEAEDLLRRIPYDKLENKELKADYALAQASLLTRRGEYEKAIPFIRDAAEAAGGTQSRRLWFLLGQVAQKAGQRQEAYEAYRKAGSGITTPYRAKLNARIQQSEVYPGGDFRKEIKALEGMGRYARNEEYLDQIYYAIGNIWLSQADTVPALENYRKAVALSTRDGIEKAVAQIALANLCFELGKYVEAQPAYSEGLAKVGETWPDYARLQRRSEVLNELAEYAATVELQDSLLELVALPPQEQMRVAERLAREARKAAREEQGSQQPPIAQTELPEGNAAAPAAYSLASNDDSWYFYNRELKEAGKKAFQQRWGKRRLEDDWRRSNKTTLSTDYTEDDAEIPDESGENKNDEKRNAEQKEMTPTSPDYYLAQIPNTPEQKEKSLEQVDNGLFNMGLILKDRLDDPRAARRSLKELITRFPDSPNRLEALHNLYLIAALLGEEEELAAMAAQIVESYPDSPLAAELADGNHIQRLRQMQAEEAGRYEAAYEAYLADENEKLHTIVEKMESDYPTSALMPRFVLLDALSAATQGDEEHFRERLNQLLSRWPEAEMSEMAAGMMANLNKGLKLQQVDSNPRGLLWTQRLAKEDTSADSTAAQPAKFSVDEEGPQYLVLVYPLDEVNANALLFEVAKFNFSTFTVKEFDLEPMNFGNVGLLIIKDFNGKSQLDAYRRMMARPEGGLALPPQVRPVDISKADFELLLREGRSFDDYFSFLESREEEAFD